MISPIILSVFVGLELTIAYDSGGQWTGDYTTDFRDLLPDGRWAMREAAVNDQNDNTDDNTPVDGPRYSLISGSMQSSFRVGGADKKSDGISHALTTTTSHAVSLIDPSLIHGAAHYALTHRSWRGLDLNVAREDEHGDTITGPAKIEVGLDGIARGYAGEKGLAASTIATMQAAADARNNPSSSTSVTSTATATATRSKEADDNKRVGRALRSGQIEIESNDTTPSSTPSLGTPSKVASKKGASTVTASSSVNDGVKGEEVDDTSFRPDGGDFLDFL
jgi:hypothetical protein